MIQALPDPLAVANHEAEWIHQNRHAALNLRIERILADCPQLDRNDLLDGLEAFHRRRMGMIPSATQYPEASPWVDYALVLDRELQRLASLDDRELAIVRSLDLYVTFHAMRRAAAADEKCRIAYLPETDRGPLSISNTDDPLTYWKPAPPPKQFPFQGGLIASGVGNGLHMDEEPEELFPLPVLQMLSMHADDTPGAVEFLTRYCPFWGRCNLLVADEQLRSVAIEKCSYKYLDVFYPGPDGRSHISGMTCRDPETVQGKHQQAMRLGYLKLFNLPMDGPDMAFWNAAKNFEDKLAAGLRDLGPHPRFEDVTRFFLARYPEGLNKWGLKPHPDSGLVGFTLQTHAILLREKVYYRWQRSEDGTEYPTEPEVYRAEDFEAALPA
ncbi:MAG: hypothetical protein ACYC6A_00420 [Armatimonadota bacterium]